MEINLRRIKANREGTEHYEKLETLVQVRENYLAAFRRLDTRENIHMVKAHRSQEEIAAEIAEIIDKLG